MSENYQENKYIITYNGQIYNTAKIREDLSSNGFSFNSHSDTEVVLKAYIHYGNDVVKHLNRYFCFCNLEYEKSRIVFSS